MSKLEALSQPVAWSWTGFPNKKQLTRCEPESWKQPRNLEPLYSQEYVTALLAENAELKASLSEWEDCKHDGATYHDMSGRERCGRCGADL